MDVSSGEAISIKSSRLIPIYRDTRARISVLEENIKDVPCDQIAGIVIYDLPGRDCAAKASNGELAVGDLPIYKSEYIDRKLSTILLEIHG